jgi:hypothetical protein
MSRRPEACAEAGRSAAARHVARPAAPRSDARELEALRTVTRTVLTLVALLVGACGASTAATAPTTPSEEEPGPELALALQLVEAAPDPDVDMPRSEVRVVLIDPSGQRSEESVGVFSGICQPAALSNALVGVSCWWAGSGERIRARKEGDTVVVTRAQLDEAVEGELPEERLTTVTLPPRATLRPLTGVP